MRGEAAGLTLTADNTETIAPGGKAFLPHIVVNEGNGPDAFDLAAVEKNCAEMLARADEAGIKLRGQTKTHKTVEGALLQTGGTKRYKET